MSRNVKMQFGRSGGDVQSRPGWKFIQGEEIIDDETVVLDFAPGGLYVLVTKEWNASTKAYRGHRARLIAAPEEEVYGTVASATGNLFASSNAGVTITMNADSTMSVVQSSATYNWRYALYRVDGAGGGAQESTIDPYTGTYSVTPAASAQSLPTANKRMTADVEVDPIPTDYGQVTQSGDTLTIT